MLLIVGSGQASFAACGHERVTVSGLPEEVEDTCRAMGQVLAYFKQLGFKPDLQATIIFHERVYIDMYDVRAEKIVGREQVSGFFNRRANEVQITSGHRGVARIRKPWGIEWGRAIAYSILQHELVHATTAAALGSDFDKMDRAWHEFIAYAVQFDLMESELKRSVMANYPGIEPFEYPENVNQLMHAADPDTFGVRAHLFAKENGGRAFIKNVLENEIDFSTRKLDFIYLWTE